MKLNAKTWSLTVTFLAVSTTLGYWSLFQNARSKAASVDNHSGNAAAGEWSVDDESSLTDSGHTVGKSQRMQIVSATMAQSDEAKPHVASHRRALKITKASVQFSGQSSGQSSGQGSGRSEQSRGLAIQLASAVREADEPALVRHLNQPYGRDSELGGLLIEAARKLGSSASPENRSLAQAKLSEFREVEVARYQSGKPVIGSLIQIAEAFGDVRGEASVSESILLIGDESLPRAVRSAAAVTLTKVNPSQALPFLAAYRNDLKEMLKRSGEVAAEERGFVADSIREVEELMAGL
jgi:hypothetical protein